MALLHSGVTWETLNHSGYLHKVKIKHIKTLCWLNFPSLLRIFCLGCFAEQSSPGQKNINKTEKRTGKQSKRYNQFRKKRENAIVKMKTVLRKVPEINKYQNMTPQQKNTELYRKNTKNTQSK